MPKKKIKTLENVKIDTIGYGGVGIGTLDDGKKIIVKGGALPHSTVDISVTRWKKDYVQGHISKIKEYDKNYADGKVFCPHFFSLLENNELESMPEWKIGCGGCKWQVMSYAKQLELKEQIVLDNFKRILKNQNVDVYPIIGSSADKGYRNKIEFSFGKYITGKLEEKKCLSDWSLGFHKQGEFSKIIDINSCGLVSQKANQVFEYMKNILKESGLAVHDQKTHEGVLRHLVIREGINTDQLLINLNIADAQLLSDQDKKTREDLKVQLQKDEFLQKHVTCFFITKNNGLADIIRGQDIETETLWGDGYIFEKLELTVRDQRDSETSSEGLDNETGHETTESTFRVSPFSFFQTNTMGAQKLFGQAAHLIGKVKGSILDLYCGTGTIGLSFLKMGIGNDLAGIEIVPEAIEDAYKNAEINQLKDQCYFVAGPAEKLVHEDQVLAQKLEDLDLIILDPPREGIHKKVVSFLQELKKQKNFKLLYISCNPVTMSRDVELLSSEGIFKLIKLQAVDMFPQTHHIECIGVLS